MSAIAAGQPDGAQISCSPIGRWAIRLDFLWMDRTEGSGVLRSTFVCRARPVCGEGARWRSRCVTVSVSFRLAPDTFVTSKKEEPCPTHSRLIRSSPA